MIYQAKKFSDTLKDFLSGKSVSPLKLYKHAVAKRNTTGYLGLKEDNIKVTIKKGGCHQVSWIGSNSVGLLIGNKTYTVKKSEIYFTLAFIP